MKRSKGESIMEKLIKRALDIAHLFDVPRGEMTCEPYGTGNINDTFCLTVRPWTGAARRYILQRVNRYVFPDPQSMMGNIQRVTHYLRGVIAREGGDPARETLTLVRAMDGRPWITDASGDLWRVYLFIEGTVSTDRPETPERFAAAGEAFGRFQRQLGGFDASTLYPTLPNFHNTPERLRTLFEDAEKDPLGLAGSVREELSYIRSVSSQACEMARMQREGRLPIRVTHNDTKINNVLFDAETDRALVVIDLDTVMPGLVGHDYGDAIRFAANYVSEDSPEAEKAGVNMEVFRAFTEGFLKQTAATLTQAEIDTLGISCFALACAGLRTGDAVSG